MKVSTILANLALSREGGEFRAHRGSRAPPLVPSCISSSVKTCQEALWVHPYAPRGHKDTATVVWAQVGAVQALRLVLEGDRRLRDVCSVALQVASTVQNASWRVESG